MSNIAIDTADINDERSTLEITWNDGHASVYPLRYVRAECPCAGCRTEREEAKSNPFHVVSGSVTPASITVADVEPVGRYGMRIVWKDGHATGIYTFEYMRGICPCAACKSARIEDPTPYVHGIYIPR